MKFILISVLCTMSCAVAFAGRIGYPDLLSKVLYEEDWHSCAGEDEICYTDKDCCDDSHKCLPSQHVRGPPRVCTDIPSRMYRHLIGEPAAAGIKDNKAVSGTKKYEVCKDSSECAENFCCQEIYYFRIRNRRICDIEKSDSRCL